MGIMLGKLKECLEMRVFLRTKLKSSSVTLKGFGIELTKTSLFFLI